MLICGYNLQETNPPDQKKDVAGIYVNCSPIDPAVDLLSSALAVIDGSLSQLTREGASARSCAPLATAVVEFRGGPMCVYVRELPHGLLPGMPNLYCLDGNLRMKWMAEWPADCGHCISIDDISDEVLTAESASGAIVRLDAHTGRIIGLDQPLAVAG